MNIVGEDAIGIGTDFTQGHGHDFFEWLTHDKGYARRLTNFGKIVNPLGIRTVGEFPTSPRPCSSAACPSAWCAR